MSTSAVDTFMQESPSKVYENAQKFSKTLGRFTQLPLSITKQTFVRNLAEDRTDDIRYSIQSAHYQNELYKRLEIADMKQRKSFDSKIVQKEHKNESNLQQLRKKQEKECERIAKHQAQVFKKHVEMQKHKKMDKDQEALKLRKSLLEFYDKEKQRKKEADAKQVSVSTCYTDAVNRLDKIHHKNQEYAQKSERQHLLRMARNSARDRNVLEISRKKSFENKKKQEVYDANCEILEDKQHRYIQTYCKDLDASIKAFDHKDVQNKKSKERIHKFFKERVQKWHSSKKRQDEKKEHISDRCISIMDKTSKAFFRKTISSFKQSSRNWLNKVHQNKSMIYQKDEHDKDKIMQIHMDLRLRNTSSFKVEEKMNSMRRQAHKLSNEFM